MQRFILVVAILFLQFIYGQTNQYDVVIKNVNIVTLDSDVVLKNQNIAIKDGKIAVIESTKKSKLKGKKVIDLKGKYILPSLADAHAHFPDTEIDMERFLNLNTINGVTKLRSMRGDWKHKEWREKFNAKDSYFAKLYLSPPPIHRKLEASSTDLDTYVKKAKENGFDFIKILSIKDQATFEQLTSLCKKYAIPLGGHFPSNPKGVIIGDALIFSNYTFMEHLGGLVGEPDVLDKRITAIKENNIFICPTLSWYDIGSGHHSYDELRNQPGMEFIPKTTVEEWIEKTKAYREKLGNDAYKAEVSSELKTLDEKYEVIRKLQQANVKLLLSPDSSSKYMVTGFGLVGEMELLKKAQLSNFEILKMAATNIASLFKENYGILAVGKDADFIVVDTNPLEDLQTLRKIKGLYFNNIYLSPEDLEKIKSKLVSETNK